MDPAGWPLVVNWQEIETLGGSCWLRQNKNKNETKQQQRNNLFWEEKAPLYSLEMTE